MAATTAKICMVCNEDCSARPRTKDAQGRYYCKPCYENALAKRKHSPTDLKTERRSKHGHDPAHHDKGDEDALGILDALIATAPPVVVQSPTAVQACPRCHARLPEGSATCPACERFLQSKKAAKRAASDQRFTFAWDGSTIASLAVGGGLSLLWLVMFLAGQQNLGWALGFVLVFFLVAVGYLIWILIAGLRRNLLTAIGCLFLPLYFLYFVFGVHRGKALMTATVQHVVGSVLMLILVNSASFEKRMAKFEADAESRMAELDRSMAAATGRSSSPLSLHQPDLPPPQTLQPGVVFHQVSLDRGGRRKLWIYLPEQPAATPSPCVLIAPAGSGLFHGMALADGDRPEHVPYVQAGFAVVAYEIDGSLPDSPREREVVEAARMFQQADAGLANARAAIDYIVAKVPAIDSRNLFVAGHSSAATLSLLVAENEPRIKACIAYAPVTDLHMFLGDDLINNLGQTLPNYEVFMTKASPLTGISRLKCPLFLFHADDDSTVPVESSESFARMVSHHNRSVKFVRVPSGEHYDSMMQQGMPAAIAWLKAVAGRP